MVANQKVMRGLALIAVSLFFGLQAASYNVGSFERAGAGLFPLLVSSVVGLIGLAMLVQSRFEPAEPMSFNLRNILIIMLGLIGFVLIAQHLKMILAIIYLVFVATLAGSDYSVRRNLRICTALIAIAFAFHSLLGLQLPLL